MKKRTAPGHVSVFKGGLGPAMDTFAKQYRAILRNNRKAAVAQLETMKPLVKAKDTKYDRPPAR